MAEPGVDQICLVQLHRDVAVLPLSCSCVLLVLGLEHGDEAIQHGVIAAEHRTTARRAPRKGKGAHLNLGRGVMS